MYRLDLESTQNQILSNVSDEAERSSLLAAMDELGLSAHYALFSSGTTGGPRKGYFLSRQALINNALAVNDRLGLSETDKWGASLPAYHIGGLAIYFRARLLGHDPFNLRPWTPKFSVPQIQKERITVISLVPTQLHDLVEHKIPCPPLLKSVLIGGDFLGGELESRARDLGWPVVRTFGMSEVGSQLCTGEDENGYLIPLPIHQIKTGAAGELLIKSLSLFSYEFTRRESNWEMTPANGAMDADGFYPLKDRVKLKNGNLLHLSRLDSKFKSAGHLIDISLVRELLEKLLLKYHLWGEAEIVPEANPRSGMTLNLYHSAKVSGPVLIDLMEQLHPIKIDKILMKKVLDRTELGKFKLG